MAACHKELGGVTPRLSAYFTTDWAPADISRVSLPVALDLPGLYAGLLMPIFPIQTRQGETVSEVTDRIEQVRKLHREITAVEKWLRNEPQFNRRVELRRQLRDRTAALAALTNPAPPKTEELPWTN